jgi:hypothetical protein
MGRALAPVSGCAQFFQGVAAPDIAPARAGELLSHEGVGPASLKSIKSDGPINLNRLPETVRQVKTFHSATT